MTAAASRSSITRLDIPTGRSFGAFVDASQDEAAVAATDWNGFEVGTVSVTASLHAAVDRAGLPCVAHGGG